MRIPKARVSPACCVPLLALLALPACKKPDAGAVPHSSAAVQASAGLSPAAVPTVPPIPHVYTAAEADELLLQWEMGKVKIPEDNPQSTPKIELGHQLFFDKRLSVDGSRSCYSCHQTQTAAAGTSRSAWEPQTRSSLVTPPGCGTSDFCRVYIGTGACIRLRRKRSTPSRAI